MTGLDALQRGLTGLLGLPRDFEIALFPATFEETDIP